MNPETGQADNAAFQWLAAAVAQRIKGVLVIVFVVAAVTTTFALLRARHYTSAASFMSTQRTAPGMQGVANIAAQFGFGAGSLEGGPNPNFYADLVRTREILAGVLWHSYSVRTSEGMATANLLDFLEVEGADSLVRTTTGIEQMSELVSAAVNTRTGVVNLSVRAPSPDLAQQVTQEILDQINRFNLERRQSQASAERRFTEARMQEIGTELAKAEAELVEFLRANAQLTAPLLVVERERLLREVERQQTMYTMLAEAYEQARIEEVRDIPVITIVEEPNLPVDPDSRQVVRYGFIALVIGSLLGVFWAWSSQVVSNMRVLRESAQEA